MIYSKMTYRCTFEEYFIFDFEHMNHDEKSKYITNGYRHEYLRYLNQNDFYHRFTDKYETYLMYKKYYKREMEYIKSEKDRELFIEFCEKYKTIVKKPLDSSLGKGIQLIEINKQNLNKLFDKLMLENEKFIIEERIIQAKEMSKLHKESVNTIRVVPYINENNEIVIHYPFLKVGRDNSFVDNGGAGGILATIDSLTGKVISDGMDEMRNVYQYHPNTNVRFKGFQIPKWDEVRKLAVELSKVNPEARYVGWDLAYTNKGWIVVEGNGKTMFVGQQMPIRKGLKDEFEELINWRNVPNKEQYKTSKKKKVS